MSDTPNPEKKVKQPALKRGGMVVGPFHHEPTGGPQFPLTDTGQVIEEEGFEFNIPEEITNNGQVYTFTGKNVEIIHEILKLGGLSAFDKVTHVKSGDIVICIKSAWDDKIRTITGTIPEILSAINTSCGCKHIQRGATVEELGEDKTASLDSIIYEKKLGGNAGNDDLSHSEKSRIFVPSKPTKDEISNIISGTSKVTNGTAIQTASSYLRASKSTSSLDRVSHFERQDDGALREYISQNNLWLPVPSPITKIGGGGEAQVYLDNDYVVKLNACRFYDSWHDYFNSLLVHNYLFPATSYELIGFSESVDSEKKILYAVVKQRFIEATSITKLLEIRKVMSDLGFIFTGGKHYRHPELDIELKDLHEGNVLTKDNVLYFIDTIFYLKGYYKNGGPITSDEIELNDQGGYDYSGEKKKTAKKCGLVTLPKTVVGTNCGNCIFFRNGFCEHYKVLLPVTSRQCCQYWDNMSIMSHFRNIGDAYLFPDRDGKQFPLNSRGGYDYSGKALDIAREADLITLPENIEGTNCAVKNCMYAKENFCIHPRIMLPVTPRMSCSWYDNEDIIRPWGKPVETEFGAGGKTGYKQKMKDWQADNPDSPRWKKKKEAILQLSNTIQKLRNKLRRDIGSDDEREALTALVIAIMDKTGERVGNTKSADKGHFGVTGFTKDHVDILGNKILLDYVGKTGVPHEKDFSDDRIAKALKKAIKNSPKEIDGEKNDYIFVTTKGIQTSSKQVNDYLEKFGITSKNLRGYFANRNIIKLLTRENKKHVPETEKARKKIFNRVLKQTAELVGHNPPTLRKHYMVPELPIEYIQKGNIIDLKNYGYHKQGGELGDTDIAKHFVNPNEAPQIIAETTSMLYERASQLDGGIKELFKSFPVEEVSWELLVPSQDSLRTDSMAYQKSVEDLYGGDLPWMIKHEGKYYFEDGHHRAVEMHNRNIPVKAHVYDIEAQQNKSSEMKNAGRVDDLDKKGTMFRGKEFIKYELKDNNRYKIKFYTLEETEGVAPRLCDKFGTCTIIDTENATPKELRKYISENNFLKYGGPMKTPAKLNHGGHAHLRTIDAKEIKSKKIISAFLKAKDREIHTFMTTGGNRDESNLSSFGIEKLKGIVSKYIWIDLNQGVGIASNSVNKLSDADWQEVYQTIKGIYYKKEGGPVETGEDIFNEKELEKILTEEYHVYPEYAISYIESSGYIKQKNPSFSTRQVMDELERQYPQLTQLKNSNLSEGAKKYAEALRKNKMATGGEVVDLGLGTVGNGIVVKYYDKIVQAIQTVKEEMADTGPSKESMLKDMLFGLVEKLQELVVHVPSLMQKAKLLQLAFKAGGNVKDISIEDITKLQAETKQLSDSEVVELYPIFFDGKEIKENKVTPAIQKELAEKIFESTKKVDVLEDLAKGKVIQLKRGGKSEGVDLFEDYKNIPTQVQEILDKHEQGISDGDYDVLAEALQEMEKIGYTFDYYLDGVAYDLRKIGEIGKVEYAKKHHIGLFADERFELFYNIVRKSDSFEDFWKGILKMEVPSDVSDAFDERYNPDKKLSLKESLNLFYNDVKVGLMAGGGETGIPSRYKNMGFSKVGQKKKSTRSKKKWMVLAKKGDKYKVVHGGEKGMKDFSQHRDKDRQKRFWNRMGGFDSEKASDPFSPLYWHKRFGTWEKGGVLDEGTIKVAWVDSDTPDIMESKMFDSVEDALSYSEGKTFLIFELEDAHDDYYKWSLLPYGMYSKYKMALDWSKMAEGGQFDKLKVGQWIYFSFDMGQLYGNRKFQGSGKIVAVDKDEEGNKFYSVEYEFGQRKKITHIKPSQIINTNDPEESGMVAKGTPPKYETYKDKFYSWMNPDVPAQISFIRTEDFGDMGVIHYYKLSLKDKDGNSLGSSKWTSEKNLSKTPIKKGMKDLGGSAGESKQVFWTLPETTPVHDQKGTAIVIEKNGAPVKHAHGEYQLWKVYMEPPQGDKYWLQTGLSYEKAHKRAEDLKDTIEAGYKVKERMDAYHQSQK